MGFFSKLFNKEMDTTPTPEQPINTPNEQHTDTSNEKFHMTVEDVFSIIGRGTVVTGKIDSGEIHVGETIIINGGKNTEILGIELFRKSLDYAKAGDACGILLKDISRNEIQKGDELTK